MSQDRLPRALLVQSLGHILLNLRDFHLLELDNLMVELRYLALYSLALLDIGLTFRALNLLHKVEV